MPRELTRDQTYQAFDLETDLRLQIIDYLEQVPASDIKTEDEIQRCLIQDRMWQMLRIEKEDYNLAIARHRLEEDEDVLRRTEEVEKRISEELRASLIEPLF